MAYPATAQCGFRNAWTHPFEKRKGPVKRIVMAIQARWYIFGKFFGCTIFFGFGMHTGRQRICHIFMREFFFTGGLDNMALGQAVDFFRRLMWNLLDVRMASFAFYFGMNAIVKYSFVDVQESEIAFLIHSAQTGIFMA